MVKLAELTGSASALLLPRLAGSALLSTNVIAHGSWRSRVSPLLPASQNQSPASQTAPLGTQAHKPRVALGAKSRRRDGRERCSRRDAALLEGLRAGEAQVQGLRPRARRGHARGCHSLSAPFDQLAAQLSPLQRQHKYINGDAIYLRTEISSCCGSAPRIAPRARTRGRLEVGGRDVIIARTPRELPRKEPSKDGGTESLHQILLPPQLYRNRLVISLSRHTVSICARQLDTEERFATIAWERRAGKTAQSEARWHRR